MADGHVVIGLSLFIALVASRFHFPNSDIGYSVVKPSLWTAVLSYRIFSIKVSCYHRVKNPLVKWTKRGSTMIRLTESTYVSCLACTESILLCGDIHPHPGLNNPERLSIGTNVDSGKPMPARTTYSARQLLSFNFQHGAHVIGDLALACNQQAGILRGSTNYIVTPSRIQVHVIESCLRRSPRRLNHANLANCTNLSPMADYANNPTRSGAPLRPITLDKALQPSCYAIAQRDRVLLLLDVGKIGPSDVISGLFHFLAMSRKKVTTYPVFTWPTHALLKRSLTSLLPSYYLLVWILQSSLSHGLMIGLTTVSSPSWAMFYSVETVRLVEAAFALLFHPASPSKGGLIWSHQIMNACGCGFVLRACLVHLWHHRWCYVLP